LHHLQPRRLGLGQGFVMAHTDLQPQGPGADGHRFVGNGRHGSAVAKHIYQVNAVVLCGLGQ